jgi:histone acetyltransferase (RNA polymerase elongator complex component)
MRYKIIPVFIPHASCPEQCVFCDQKKITGVAVYDLDTVKDTIEKCIRSFKEDGKKGEIAYYGGSFTAIPEDTQVELLKVGKARINSGAVESIRVSTRPDYIDSKTLTRLKEYGVKTIELGVQSMSDGVLAANRRGHTREDTIRASTMIKEAGFLLGHQVMPGLYTDTYETMLYTATESLKLKPDFLRVYPCLVIRGTELFKLFKEGEYVPLTIDSAVNICKEIYKMAKAAGVTVIRMGIHPERDFVEGGYVAGPFHPAFKHLVISALFSDLIDLLIEKSEYDAGASKDVIFKVNDRDVSNFVGINKKNLKRLKVRYPNSEVRLKREEGIKEGDIVIDYCNRSIKASILDL